MGKGLSKTELTGVILLGILIVAITAVPIMMKNCSGERGNEADIPVMTVVDSADYVHPDTKVAGKRNSGKRGGKRKRGGSYGTKVKKERTAVERTDPFSDTIPMEWDDE